MCNRVKSCTKHGRYLYVWSRALPRSSQVVILIVVTLISYNKYHDKALILSEFLCMKTVREIEMAQCISTELNRHLDIFSLGLYNMAWHRFKAQHAQGHAIKTMV